MRYLKKRKYLNKKKNKYKYIYFKEYKNGKQVQIKKEEYYKKKQKGGQIVQKGGPVESYVPPHLRKSFKSKLKIPYVPPHLRKSFKSKLKIPYVPHLQRNTRLLNKNYSLVNINENLKIAWGNGSFYFNLPLKYPDVFNLNYKGKLKETKINKYYSLSDIHFPLTPFKWERIKNRVIIDTEILDSIEEDLGLYKSECIFIYNSTIFTCFGLPDIKFMPLQCLLTHFKDSRLDEYELNKILDPIIRKNLELYHKDNVKVFQKYMEDAEKSIDSGMKGLRIKDYEKMESNQLYILTLMRSIKFPKYYVFYLRFKKVNFKCILDLFLRPILTQGLINSLEEMYNYIIEFMDARRKGYSLCEPLVKIGLGIMEIKCSIEGTNVANTYIAGTSMNFIPLFDLIKLLKLQLNSIGKQKRIGIELFSCSISPNTMETYGLFQGFKLPFFKSNPYQRVTKFTYNKEKTKLKDFMTDEPILLTQLKGYISVNQIKENCWGGKLMCFSTKPHKSTSPEYGLEVLIFRDGEDKFWLYQIYGTKDRVRPKIILENSIATYVENESGMLYFVYEKKLDNFDVKDWLKKAKEEVGINVVQTERQYESYKKVFESDSYLDNFVLDIFTRNQIHLGIKIGILLFGKGLFRVGNFIFYPNLEFAKLLNDEIEKNPNQNEILLLLMLFRNHLDKYFSQLPESIKLLLKTQMYYIGWYIPSSLRNLVKEFNDNFEENFLTSNKLPTTLNFTEEDLTLPDKLLLYTSDRRTEILKMLGNNRNVSIENGYILFNILDAISKTNQKERSSQLLLSKLDPNMKYTIRDFQGEDIRQFQEVINKCLLYMSKFNDYKFNEELSIIAHHKSDFKLQRTFHIHCYSKYNDILAKIRSKIGKLTIYNNYDIVRLYNCYRITEKNYYSENVYTWIAVSFDKIRYLDLQYLFL